MKTAVRELSMLVDRLCKHPQRDAFKGLIDLALIVFCAAWVWFDSFGQIRSPGNPLPFIFLVVAARSFIYIVLRLHRTSWRDVCRYDLLWLAASAALGPPLVGLLFLLLPDPFTLSALVRPRHVLIIEPTFYLLLLSGARITVRALEATRREPNTRRILIVGTRAAARSIAYQVQESTVGYRVVGFVDDDPQIQGRRIRGVPVLGTMTDLGRLIESKEVEQVVLANPSLSPYEIRRVLEICEPTGVPIRVLPPLRELMGTKPGLNALREVRMEDLLPRPEVQIDRKAITGYLSGQTVLVTGGGGSIGGELCRQVLAAGAARLIVMGRGENSVFEMVQELNEQRGACEVVPVICDIRDRIALEQVFQRHQPKVIFHAAAHKHVPLMELYPAEAIKNNVLGTVNVARLSAQHGVKRFVLVSTDKAVDPRSVMGATKHIAELIVAGCARAYDTSMVSVRFGNVLGSRGSVVPVMTRQIRKRLPITVTDPDMVRYFMTIPEAVSLILQAGTKRGCGEVFVLDMGHPVRIIDLARDLIRLSGLVPHQDIEILITGKRPGEKVKEDVLTSLESAGARKNGHFYTAPSRPVNLEQLYSLIDDLRLAAEADDRDQILEIIGAIVPSFKPDVDYHTTSTDKSFSPGKNTVAPAGKGSPETVAVHGVLVSKVTVA